MSTMTERAIAGPMPLPPRPPSTGLVSDDLDPWWDAWVPHPGRALVPQRINWIYAQAEHGWPQQQCDLADDIVQNDGHLRSQIETRRRSVAGKEWIIQAGGDSPVDHLAAQVLEQAIRDVPNFGETLEHQLTQPWYGWAASEIEWGISASGAIAPVRFANVPHRRFLFGPRDDPRIIVEGHFADGVTLDPGRWLFSKNYHRRTAMSGLLRTAIWWATFKRMATRDWVSYAERFGLPLPVGKYSDATPKEEKAALMKAVAQIGKDGFAVMHDSCAIEFAQASASTSQDVHAGLAGFCNAEMSKLITGATLTSGEGTSAGSYALGRVHENVSFNLVQFDATSLGNWFSQHVGIPFCYWNGLPARPPRLRLNVVREMDPVQRINTLAVALNSLGVDLSKDQVRQENSIKAPMNDADALKRTEAAPPPPTPRQPPSEVG